MNEQDRRNRSAWTAPAAVSWLSNAEGFTDEGERAAFWHLVDEVRGRPILDLGVGGGRTIPIMRALTKDYVAMDYLPELVEAARRRFPSVDVQLGDARDLSRFGNDRFHLVVFSYSGIDAVAHEDRTRILTEVHRVLQPGGVFWCSTLNKDGSGPRSRPWRPHWPQPGGLSLRHVAESLQSVKSMPRGVVNYFRRRGLWREGEGWSVAAMSAH